jgi:predicted phage terminase large subunit-like protein
MSCAPGRPERYGNHIAPPIYIEDKANGPAIISQLRRSVPAMIAVPPEGDKVARARSVAALVEAGDVFLPGAPNADESDCDRTVTPEWVQALIEECATFPNAAHDDQVDALSQALRALSGAGPGVRRKSTGKTLTGGLKTQAL